MRKTNMACYKVWTGWALVSSFALLLLIVPGETNVCVLLGGKDSGCVGDLSLRCDVIVCLDGGPMGCLMFAMGIFESKTTVKIISFSSTHQWINQE